MILRPSLLPVFFTILFVSCGPRVTRMPAPKTAPEKVDNRTVPSRQSVLIGLRDDVERVVIRSAAGFTAKAAGANAVETWREGPHTITAERGKVLIDGEPSGAQVKLTPAAGSDGLEVGEKPYRGNVIVKASGQNRITVINELSIDDYLKGVLPREVVESWPDECLRVQAVASRTYLASHLGRHRNRGFDLCSDVHCQVYGGTNKESPKCSAAVDATRGQILVYQEKPISAYFHSNCGGITEEVQYVWGLTPQRYLPRKRCGFGTKDPRYNWTWSLDDPSILAALKKSGKAQGSVIKKIDLVKKSQSGRAEAISVVTDKGVFKMKGNDFRIALHPEKVRSTLWTSFSHRGGRLKLSGTGWGHGVGMCQWGAKGMAEAGRPYREILSFYYPHAELQLWNRL